MIRKVRQVGARWILLTLILIGLVLRIAAIDAQSIWRDEADSLRFATSPATVRAMFLHPGHNAPLYYLALHGWMHIAGESLTAARLFSALWGTLSIALAFAVARRLLGTKVGLLAAGLMATSPYLIWYSQEARTYTLLVAAILASTWLYLEALERGGLGRWMAYLGSVAVILYLHVVAALILPVHVLTGLLIRPRGRSGWLGWSAVTALMLMPALPLLWWELRVLASPLQTGHPPASLGEIAGGLLLGLTTGPSGQLPVALAIPGLFLALIGIAGPAVRTEGTNIRQWCNPSILLAWLLLPPLGLAAISAIKPIFSERYLIFIAPAFYMLSAQGVHYLKGIWKPLAAVALVAVLLVNGAGIWIQATQVIKPDFRSAGRYFEAHQQPGDAVLFLIPQGQGPFERVITPIDDDRLLPAPYANGAANASDLDAELSDLIGGVGRVWVVESEPELWDSQGLVLRWLDRHCHQVDRQAFHLVTLYLYDGVSY